MLHPDFPIVEGKYQMTNKWSINLPAKFNRRFEEDSLIIWKPDFITLWIIVWDNNKNLSPKDQIAKLKKSISKDAYDINEIELPVYYRLTYRLREKRENKTVFASYGFISGKSGYVQIAIYYDDEKNSDVAQKIFETVKEDGVSM